VKCRDTPVLATYVEDSTGARTPLSPRCEKLPTYLDFLLPLKTPETPASVFAYLFTAWDFDLSAAVTNIKETKPDTMRSAQGWVVVKILVP